MEASRSPTLIFDAAAFAAASIWACGVRLAASSAAYWTSSSSFFFFAASSASSY